MIQYNLSVYIMDFASNHKVPEGLLITWPKCFAFIHYFLPSQAFYDLIYRETPTHLLAEATGSKSWMIYLRGI